MQIYHLLLTMPLVEVARVGEVLMETTPTSAGGSYGGHGSPGKATLHLVPYTVMITSPI